MKKILFGSAAAIFAVMGFSSFKTANKKANTTWYFTIKSTSNFASNYTGAIPLADLQSVQGSESFSGCGGSANLCVVTFGAGADISSSGTILATANVSSVATLRAL